ncbi:hypothetical protein F5146DRAFT_601551 [Armillaria mellea]|nr:hypothetical protein F5146DRAFT_601551 [Armillaria mellea]
MSVMALSMFLFLLLGVQVQTYVAALDPRFLSWSRALHVVNRQVSGIPSQCQTPCSAADALVSANCTQPQCCTSGFENDYVTCVECVGNAANITNYTLPQTTVDELVVSCSLKGIVIPKVTFPGQDPNRQLATSVIAASGTGDGSSTPTSLLTSVVTPATSQIAASISSISRSTITSITPASSTPVTERSSAPVSTSTTPAASATADSAVAMESEILWIVSAWVAFLFWA